MSTPWSREEKAAAQQAAIRRAAADWVVRRDRGLTAEEQDRFLHWLREDPAHRQAWAEQQHVLQRLMQLADWQPVQSEEPNPDLFAPPPRPYLRKWWPVGVAAALLVLAVFFRGDGSLPSPSRVPAADTYVRLNEQRVLPDGSTVELNDGSVLEVHFTAQERRVRLSGEAHFTVAKNSQRPFSVDASGVVIRAVGTAFNVRQDPTSVEVLVTEGKVCLLPAAPAAQAPADAAPPAFVSAGQNALVPLAEGLGATKVGAVSTAQIDEALRWKTPRLQFHETPLREAVAEFNRYNRQQLVLDPSDLGSLRIGGTFRVHNVEGFVRLLKISAGIEAEPNGADLIVLRRAPASARP